MDAGCVVTCLSLVLRHLHHHAVVGGAGQLDRVEIDWVVEALLAHRAAEERVAAHGGLKVVGLELRVARVAAQHLEYFAEGAVVGVGVVGR